MGNKYIWLGTQLQKSLSLVSYAKRILRSKSMVSNDQSHSKVGGPRRCALSVYLILLSFPSPYEGFVVNFHVNKICVPLEQLTNMLKTYESIIKKEKLAVLMKCPQDLEYQQ